MHVQKNKTSHIINTFKICYVVVLFSSLSLSAQDSVFEKIDTYVTKQMQQTHTHGVAIGVVKNKKIIIAKE